MLGGGNTPSCRPAGPHAVGVARTLLCGSQELFLISLGTHASGNPVQTDWVRPRSAKCATAPMPARHHPTPSPPYLYVRCAHRPTATGCLPTTTVWGKSCLQS